MEAKDTLVEPETIMTMAIDLSIMRLGGTDLIVEALKRHLLKQAEVSFQAGFQSGFAAQEMR